MALSYLILICRLHQKSKIVFRKLFDNYLTEADDEYD